MAEVGLGELLRETDPYETSEHFECQEGFDTLKWFGTFLMQMFQLVMFWNYPLDNGLKKRSGFLWHGSKQK